MKYKTLLRSLLAVYFSLSFYPSIGTDNQDDFYDYQPPAKKRRIQQENGKGDVNVIPDQPELPQEMIFNIFTFSHPRMIGRYQQVSKEWLDAINGKSDSLWPSIAKAIGILFKEPKEARNYVKGHIHLVNAYVHEVRNEEDKVKQEIENAFKCGYSLATSKMFVNIQATRRGRYSIDEMYAEIQKLIEERVEANDYAAINIKRDALLRGIYGYPKDHKSAYELKLKYNEFNPAFDPISDEIDNQLYEWGNNIPNEEEAHKLIEKYSKQNHPYANELKILGLMNNENGYTKDEKAAFELLMSQFKLNNFKAIEIAINIYVTTDSDLGKQIIEQQIKMNNHPYALKLKISGLINGSAMYKKNKDEAIKLINLKNVAYPY